MPETDLLTDDDAGPEEDGGERKMDTELRVMGQMLRMLRDLDRTARGRVVRYLASRFPDEQG